MDQILREMQDGTFDFEGSFVSAGVAPSGPVSAWPKDRNDQLIKFAQSGKILIVHPDHIGKNGRFTEDAKIMSKQEADARFAPPEQRTVKHDTKVQAGPLAMAKNLTKSAQYATRGRVGAEIREERLETCRACPHFIESSKRCSQCGCFMEAKTWLNADPDDLCPKQKWAR